MYLMNWLLLNVLVESEASSRFSVAQAWRDSKYNRPSRLPLIMIRDHRLTLRLLRDAAPISLTGFVAKTIAPKGRNIFEGCGDGMKKSTAFF